MRYQEEVYESDKGCKGIERPVLKDRERRSHLLKACIIIFGSAIILVNVINLKLSLAWSNPDLSGYLQTAPWKCGPAAMRVVLAFYDIETTEDEVAKIAGTDLSGTTLYGLQQAARAYGLDAIGERWNWTRLLNEEHPVIAYVDNNHYVVVLGIEDGYVNLLDPATGQVQNRKEVFESKWNGEVLSIINKTMEKERGFDHE
jgi:hypothetical protein